MSTPDELADRAAIAEVVAGLAHAQDDRDWTSLRRLFADEVLLDLSTHHFGRPPTTVAAADLVELARGTLDGFDCTHHAASTPLVRLAGDEAECRVHVVAYHHVPAAPGVVDFCTMRGFWQLTLSRLHGRWLITRWAVRRTCPWEGSPDVYALAAARTAPES
ncbi:nuclear transport factor 2 family protein [Lentzea sp. NEAU-D7]|uniref:nuclear transport factor 2 family protein n=1 Tax=Lentzea sp. NEAU-D7 TaxID=2994667 RepID=UPI00224A8BB3|nr:nuclear transport factor 2 family protein [Lentzea sp. NEAU-D7]MCX2946807.1 nuclear transport factor 2 family protein [Lentzea sp. NEAU-D7]